MKFFHHNKWLTTIIIAIPILLLAIFVIPGKLLAGPDKNQDSYFNKIIGGLSLAESNASKKDLLKVFCDTMKRIEVQEGFIDESNGGIYYSPSQSLFVEVLCKSIINDDTFSNNKIVKSTSWDAILGNIPAGCDPSGDLGDCDLSTLLPALFNIVMNDHSTLSIAGWAMKGNTDEAIQQFSTTYFGNLEKICGEKNNQYLGAKSSATKQDAMCSHPITYQALKNTISSLITQKKNLRIIDGDGFGDDIKKGDCTGEKRYNNLFLCGYTNTDSSDAGKYQYNLRYNELLYYKVLIGWLTDNKLKDPNIKPLNLTKNVTVDLSNEIQNLKREEIISEKAVQIMQKSINNIHATFPLHIGLQAYYEDVISFRKSLAKVYTPIHQLYYKLRNIQVKK